MSDYTTIQINKNLKKKLEELKKETGRNRYDEVIEDLLTGGKIIDDVITIERELVAFTLNYWHENGETIKKDITYAELRNSIIGDEFIACDYNIFPIGDYVNSSAKVIAIVNNGEDIILMVTEKSRRNQKLEYVKSVVHVKMF